MLFHYIYYLYSRLTTRLLSTAYSLLWTTYPFAINNIHICYQQHTHLRSTTYAFAINNILVCYQQHTRLLSTKYSFTINNILVYYQPHTRLLSTTYSFAVNNIPVLASTTYILLGVVPKHIVLTFAIVPL